LIITLSPMAGVSDKSFRKLCTSMGADVTFTEMISVNGLTKKNKKSFQMLPDVDEHAVVQLFGKEPELFLRAAELIGDRARWIDINAACPVFKVTKRGYGSALMKTPSLLRKIVELLSSNGIKVSVKMRIGWEEQKNFMEVARAASDGGAFLITIHGRTVEQGYSGKADWEPAKLLKKALKTKIGISGDIFTPYDAVNASTFTNADYIFIARGSIGNPWIFEDTKSLVANGEFSLPSLVEREKIIKKHLDMEIEEYGLHGIIMFRKFLVRYIKNLPQSHEIKESFMRMENYEELTKVLDAYFDKLISCEQGGVEGGNIEG
jgi:tRNA-dihydrouridine synthase B